MLRSGPASVWLQQVLAGNTELSFWIHFPFDSVYSPIPWILLCSRGIKAILLLIKCGDLTKYFNPGKKKKKPKGQMLSLSKADIQFLTKKEKESWRERVREEPIANYKRTPIASTLCTWRITPDCLPNTFLQPCLSPAPRGSWKLKSIHSTNNGKHLHGKHWAEHWDSNTNKTRSLTFKGLKSLEKIPITFEHFIRCFTLASCSHSHPSMK